MYIKSQTPKASNNCSFFPSRSLLNKNNSSDTADSLSDIWEIKVEAILATISQLASNLHYLSGSTLHKLESNLTSLCQQISNTSSLKKEISTPHLQQVVKSDSRITISTNSAQQLKELEVDIELLKVSQLKMELQQETQRKHNLHTLGRIQAKYVGKGPMTPICQHLHRLMKEV